jgi:hypothetical protein
MVNIIFPADGITLNFLVEGELGCLHCIEAGFDLGLLVMHLWYFPSNNPVKHIFYFNCIL